MKNTINLLKISSALWILWGLVHILAGVLTIKGHLSGDISSSIAGIADDADATSLQMNYPDATSAIIAQHGFNLLWIGLITFICAFYIWKGNYYAAFVAGITGGLADLGYFIFLDLGGYVKFAPGTVMTIVSASAIILSSYAYFQERKSHI